MYIITNEGEYRELKSLKFAPELDLTLTALPVNEFIAEIVTTDDIATGGRAELLDDMNARWAYFVITKSERLDARVVRITAQSELALLDRWTCAATFYNNMSARDVLYDILHASPVRGHRYNVTISFEDSSTARSTVRGYCPEQTARERLQWLCLDRGVYVEQTFSGAGLRLLDAGLFQDEWGFYDSEKGALIPLSDTYMKPSVTVLDDVLSISITTYDGWQNTEPDDSSGLYTDDGESEPVQWSSVKTNADTWWYYTEEVSFTNAAVTNDVGRSYSISGVMLFSGSVDSVMERLKVAYFRRGEIQLDCINNGQYRPGDKVRFYIDEQTIMTGFVKSCDFAFGNQARSRLVISSDLGRVPTGTISIVYQYGDIPVGKNEFVLPVDENYEVENPTISWEGPDGIVTMTPDEPTTTGTVWSQDKETITPQYTVRSLPSVIRVTSTPYGDWSYDFVEGDELKLRAGYEITAYMIVGSDTEDEWGTVPIDEITIEPKYAEWDGANNGNQTVTLSWARPYDGKVLKTTTTFIIAPNPFVSIEITTPPTKTDYLNGEAIDYSGIVVTGTREFKDIQEQIPLEALIFPDATADIAAAQEGEYTNHEGINAAFMRVNLSIDPNDPRRKWMTDKPVGYVEDISPKSSSYGFYVGYYDHDVYYGADDYAAVYLTQYDGSVYVSLFEGDDSIHFYAKLRDSRLDSGYYWSASSTSLKLTGGKFVSVGAPHADDWLLPESTVDPTDTDTGRGFDIVTGVQEVAVRYTDPSTGDTLEASFKINVS